MSTVDIKDDEWLYGAIKFNIEHSTKPYVKVLGLIHSRIAQEVQKAYSNGYNDNARDCFCDGGTIPHKHLLDDGESHDIRPDTFIINKEVK